MQNRKNNASDGPFIKDNPLADYIATELITNEIAALALVDYLSSKGYLDKEEFWKHLKKYAKSYIDDVADCYKSD